MSAAIICATCDNYRLVDVDGQDDKQPCPECRPAVPPRIARIRGSNKPRGRVSNRAPITFARCPVHLQKLGVDGEGRLLGKCQGCATEYAEALRWMRENPA